MVSNPSITRSVRLNLNLYQEIELIAEYEGRTISNTIQRLLRNAVNRYEELHINSGYGKFLSQFAEKEDKFFSQFAEKKDNTSDKQPE